MIIVKVPIYYSVLLVYLNEKEFDIKDLRRKIRRYYNGDKKYVSELSSYFDKGFKEHIIEGETTGLSQLNGGIGVINMRNYDHSARQIGFLVHEINHYVFELLRSKGLFEHDSSTEAYTYLSGWITEEIMRQVQIKYDFKQDKKTKKWNLIKK